MEFFERDAFSSQSGVGAKAEARLLPLTPLVEYYEREMGELAGRLMIATNFLQDAQLMPGWKAQSEEIHQAVEQAQALVVSVMVRLLKDQTTNGRRSETLADELQQFLDHPPKREEN